MRDNITIETTVVLAAAIGEQLRAAGLIAATAESCTGGLIGHIFTENAGSSDYFAGGAVTYSYTAKEMVLGVDHATLMTQGAVCADVAQQMAQGARRLYSADLAISVTGVAGPGGGSDAKPVGSVYLHLSTNDGVEEGAHHVWQADRSGNKLLSAHAALLMIKAYLDRRG